MSYSLLRVIPQGLNFVSRRFGTLCSIFIRRVNNNNNWEEIASVFVVVKVWLKRSLGQSAQFRSEEGEPWDGSDVNIMFQDAV